MSPFGLLVTFFQYYLVPLLFAIGFLYFIYGFIEYFIIGRGGDEGRSQHGRELFLKSISWFVLGLITHLIISLLIWIHAIATTPTSTAPGGIEIRREEAILRIPNVPTVDQ